MSALPRLKLLRTARSKIAPIHVLVLVLLGSVYLRTYKLKAPDGTLIFDERYYVNAARVILGWAVEPGDPYAGQPAGVDPNSEHPPLGKLLLVASMRVCGDNALGWRMPSLLAGLAAIALVYAVVRAAGGDAWVGVLASTIFAFDNLALVHSRIGTLDMPMVACMLLGAWCWLRGQPLLAGSACAVAALIKLPAVYGFGALCLLAVGAVLAHRRRQGRGTWRGRPARDAAFLVVGFAAVWAGGLWVLDLALTPYSTPWSHLQHMLDYGFELARRGGPANVESPPWQWLANEVQMPYLRVTADAAVNGTVVETRTLIHFRGAMNPIVIGAAPLAMSYVGLRAWRGGDRVALWAVAWVLPTYAAYYPLVLLSGRTTYIFYILPAVPAVAIATAQVLRTSGLPRAVTWGYLVGLFVASADYFPFRDVF